MDSGGSFQVISRSDTGRFNGSRGDWREKMGTTPPTRLQAIWTELRKRKVIQVAAVFILMSWGVMQVGDLLFEALQVPEGAYTLLVILVLLGFPVAVVLAWAYEITPEGVRRDLVREIQSSVTSPAAGRAGPPEGIRRLAILPLRDMSSSHDLRYFCEGLAEEIQNALCRLDGLQVVARAHTVRFGGKNIDIDVIQQKLCVSSVVEGSVRQFGDVFHISIQQVSIENGTIIGSFSREYSGQSEFEIQKHVARKVARQIDGKAGRRAAPGAGSKSRRKRPEGRGDEALPRYTH